jgi:hypothetical protein
MVQEHLVEWLWWDTGESDSLPCESMQSAFELIAKLHVTAGDAGREIGTVYTRKTRRDQPHG